MGGADLQVTADGIVAVVRLASTREDHNLSFDPRIEGVIRRHRQILNRRLLRAPVGQCRAACKSVPSGTSMPGLGHSIGRTFLGFRGFTVRCTRKLDGAGM